MNVMTRDTFGTYGKGHATIKFPIHILLTMFFSTAKSKPNMTKVPIITPQIDLDPPIITAASTFNDKLSVQDDVLEARRYVT